MKKIIFILVCLVAMQLNMTAQDKLAGLRTSKQIITVDEPTAPYYTIQVLALKLPPSDANFFGSLDVVKEYPCEDGYVRYCVGSYSTFSEANSHLSEIRDKGYSEAFVANTKKFSVSASDVSYSPSRSGKLVISPNKDYVVQLAAFRYPVYLSFFENVDEVYEYRLNDKIFRYTTPPCKGSEVESVLSEMKGKGYAKAFIVDYDRYAPFKIE
ncbi:MAG: hypothetical protein J6Y82_11580 [Bacteroidales bacterium]|nr:hypothetical protein [Bacteroidales bacterium]